VKGAEVTVNPGESAGMYVDLKVLPKLRKLARECVQDENDEMSMADFMSSQDQDFPEYSALKRKDFENAVMAPELLALLEEARTKSLFVSLTFALENILEMDDEDDEMALFSLEINIKNGKATIA
jgi:hypothetical protein